LLASALSLLNVLLLTHPQLIQEFKADGRIQQLQVSWECQQFSAAGAIAQAHTVNFVAG
jgi:hypothetical protein